MRSLSSLELEGGGYAFSLLPFLSMRETALLFQYETRENDTLKLT